MPISRHTSLAIQHPEASLHLGSIRKNSSASTPLAVLFLPTITCAVIRKERLFVTRIPPTNDLELLIRTRRPQPGRHQSDGSTRPGPSGQFEVGRTFPGAVLSGTVLESCELT